MTLWTIKETAEYLQVSEVTVLEYVRQGLPRLVISPKVRRFDPEQVRAWVLSKGGNAKERRAVPSQAIREREESLRVRQDGRDSRGRSRKETEGSGGFEAAIEAISK